MLHWLSNWFRGRVVSSRSIVADEDVSLCTNNENRAVIVINGKEHYVLFAETRYVEDWPYRLDKAVIEFAYDVGSCDGADTRRATARRVRTSGGYQWDIEYYTESILPPLHERE